MVIVGAICSTAKYHTNIKSVGCFKIEGFCNETTRTGADPPFKLYSEKNDPRVMVGGDSIQRGGSWEKRVPLSSDLNKMAWICHSVYPSVWSERGTHTQQQHGKNLVARTATTTAIVLLFLFFFSAAYILCFFVSQISFIKLPAAPTLILAMSTPPKKRLFPFSPPSIKPSSLHLLG